MTYLTNNYKHTHIVCIYYVHGSIYSHTIMMLAIAFQMYVNVVV